MLFCKPNPTDVVIGLLFNPELQPLLKHLDFYYIFKLTKIKFGI